MKQLITTFNLPQLLDGFKQPNFRQYVIDEIRKRNELKWNDISSEQNLSEEFIREFQHEVDWKEISLCQRLSEDFIREFHAKVDWKNISRCQELSEDFITEFQGKVFWEEISLYQILSEHYIRKFQQKVDWDNISWKQKLSLNFIRAFKNRINFDYLKKYNKNISKKIKYKIFKPPYVLINEEINDDTCIISFCENSQLVKTRCNHIFCKDCLDKWINDSKPDCPLCRQPVIPTIHL